MLQSIGQSDASVPENRWCMTRGTAVPPFVGSFYEMRCKYRCTVWLAE
jgi:hypothetical protein